MLWIKYDGSLRGRLTIMQTPAYQYCYLGKENNDNLHSHTFFFFFTFLFFFSYFSDFWWRLRYGGTWARPKLLIRYSFYTSRWVMIHLQFTLPKCDCWVLDHKIDILALFTVTATHCKDKYVIWKPKWCSIRWFHFHICITSVWNDLNMAHGPPENS